MTITSPSIQIDEVVKELCQTEEERSTIVHCRYTDTEDISAVRIWPQTVLIQNDGTRRKLIKAFNISIMPEWTFHSGGEARFTLLFEGLTPGCTHFYLLEDIPEPGGFISGDTARNESDVYNVELYC